jgi:chromosome partitioning protein
MKTIALLSNKGGAGKTTIAINLAIAAVLEGQQVALIDVDPQGSSAQWGDSREAEEPAVVSVQASRLDKVLDAAKDSGADWCFIDTAPHSEATALKAARAADYCIIPVRPAILDLRAVSLTIDMLAIVQTPSALLINSVPTKGLALDGEKALNSLDAQTCPVHIWQRVAYMHSLTAGLGVMEYEPSGKASTEIKRLYQWLRTQV